MVLQKEQRKKGLTNWLCFCCCSLDVVIVVVVGVGVVVVVIVVVVVLKDKETNLPSNHSTVMTIRFLDDC